MGGRPLIASILAILCAVGGLLGVVYFLSVDKWVLLAVSAGGIAVGAGLWQQWRWSWWVGFGLLSYLLYHNYQHAAATSQHLWFASAVLWVYFLIVFREYN
jgi:hypothetical protein